MDKLKSKKAYEEYLNELGCSFEDCVYLTNPARGQFLGESTLMRALLNNKYGTILKKYDSIAFYTSYQDWSRSNFK